MHKSGFVNIIGKPNVGKSTLMNALLGEKLVITTHKPQTTRHRILGILNEEAYQIVFSDTPGIIDEPSYGLQKSMNKFSFSSFEDADVLIGLVEYKAEKSEIEYFAERMQHVKIPALLVVNKIDLCGDKVLQKIKTWKEEFPIFSEVIFISALKETGVKELLKTIIRHLPEGEPYYPKEQFTDRSQRFFVSEIIREKILELYHQEIPYSVEVVVTEFTEQRKNNGKEFIQIYAEIYVERKTQKGIIIGKQGTAIKELGIQARKQIEQFLSKQVFLELFVKIKPDWRNNQQSLKQFGYQ